MANRVHKAIVVLNIILLVMTGSWILFGISREIDNIELIYNYIYVFVVAVTVVLNIKMIYKK